MNNKHIYPHTNYHYVDGLKKLFPYTTEHEIDLDFLLRKIAEIESEYEGSDLVLEYDVDNNVLSLLNGEEEVITSVVIPTISGPAGPQGPQGPKGDKGDSIVGPQGPQGPVGSTGSQGIQGVQGDPGITPSISATASINNSTGTPSVTVTRTGSDTQPTLNFNFQNLKGAKGDSIVGPKGDTGNTPNIAATASVGSTVGTPEVTVTKTGTVDNPTLNFDFENLKGEKGDDGTSIRILAQYDTYNEFIHAHPTGEEGDLYQVGTWGSSGSIDNVTTDSDTGNVDGADINGTSYTFGPGESTISNISTSGPNGEVDSMDIDGNTYNFATGGGGSTIENISTDGYFVNSMDIDSSTYEFSTFDDIAYITDDDDNDVIEEAIINGDRYKFCATIDDLVDVEATTPEEGQVLTYNSSDYKWESKPINTLSIVTLEKNSQFFDILQMSVNDVETLDVLVDSYVNVPWNTYYDTQVVQINGVYLQQNGWLVVVDIYAATPTISIYSVYVTNTDAEGNATEVEVVRIT